MTVIHTATGSLQTERHRMYMSRRVNVVGVKIKTEAARLQILSSELRCVLGLRVGEWGGVPHNKYRKCTGCEWRLMVDTVASSGGVEVIPK